MSPLKNSKRISINSLNNSSPLGNPQTSPPSKHTRTASDGNIVTSTPSTAAATPTSTNPVHLHHQQTQHQQQQQEQQEHHRASTPGTSAPSQLPSSSATNQATSKIQHQFKSQEKLTLLQQVIRFNPYKNKKDGWQQVKDGYLVWKNANRPKYADPAEDYIKRKVQEILRLYARLGKESLKENGFNNKDSPGAVQFLQLIEKVLVLKKNEDATSGTFIQKQEDMDEDTDYQYDQDINAEESQSASFSIPNISTSSTFSNITTSSAIPPSSQTTALQSTSYDAGNYTIDRQKRRKISMPLQQNIHFLNSKHSDPSASKPGASPDLYSESQQQQTQQQQQQQQQPQQQNYQSHDQSVPTLAQSQTPRDRNPSTFGQQQHQRTTYTASFPGLTINTTAQTIGELQIDEFMILMNKNNQQFATTFATEFTKSLSETLCVTITKAIKETIQETSKNNLEIIKALKNQ